jgi:hypothetical protein
VQEFHGSSDERDEESCCDFEPTEDMPSMFNLVMEQSNDFTNNKSKDSGNNSQGTPIFTKDRPFLI